MPASVNCDIVYVNALKCIEMNNIKLYLKEYSHWSQSCLNDRHTQRHLTTYTIQEL